MQLIESAILTIQGIADKNVFEKLSKEYHLQENQRWVFVDYATTTIPLNTQFDVLLEGDAKSLIPGVFIIKIIECINQFGSNFQEIPEGWKTICKLDFYPEVPHKIDTLPTLQSWDYISNRITLANHKSISLNYIGADKYFSDVSDFAYYLLINSLFKNTSDIITVHDFYTYLENQFQIDHNKADNILTAFVQTGKIKPINDNRIELLPAV
jgi:hypothetical protein